MRKWLVVSVLVLALLIFTTAVMANLLSSASAAVNCIGYSLTVSAYDLTPGTTYTINYTFSETCSGMSTQMVPGSITFVAPGSTATETASGNWSLSANCTVTGSATLTSSGSTLPITFNGTSNTTASLTCAPPTLACASSTGQVGVAYKSSLVASGGVPPYTFSITSGGLPPGLTLNGSTGAITGTPTTAGSFDFTAMVVDSSGVPAANTVTGSCGITISPSSPPAACSTGPQSLAYNVSEQSNNASEIVWFNSHFKLQGNVPSTDFTVNVTNQTITFGSSTLIVPDAVITFSSSASCASTSFNTSTNQWQTTIPLSYATHADEIFSAGLAYILPSNFPQNVNNVTWNVTFTSTAPSLQFQFQYGAANYLSQDNKGDVFPLTGSGQPDYNAMMIDPVHNAPTCNGYNNGDHSGTPENPEVKNLVTGGGSGGGGSNWTGSWSSTPTYLCAAP
jgi:hypothetical protein